ncbi:transposase [Salipaludibacillus sp. CF4.18]
MTRENRRYCQQGGIRLSGPKLGRPPKEEDKEQKRIRLPRCVITKYH